MRDARLGSLTGAAAYHSAALAYQQSGRLAEAAQLCAQALAADGDDADSLHLLGIVAHQMGRTEAAATCLRRVIALRPADPAARYNLGTVLSAAGQTAEAIACLREALALRPDDAVARSNLGSTLCDAWRSEEAIVCLREAIAGRPDYAPAHNNLGVALAQLGRLEEAVASSSHALALRADYPEAHNNLGVALAQQGRLAEAIACYRRALALRPAYGEAHGNLAMALLASGDLAAGWPELEWRWQTPLLRPTRRDFAQKQWQGETAAGARLLIHAEQGFGDTLQFCRYAELAAARGLRVILEVQPPLLRLLRGLPGALVVARGEALPAFDLHCPMLSLPLALRTTLATVPPPAPLRADPVAAARMGARMAELGGSGLRVGLAWAGDPRTHVAALAAIDRRRSIPPELLAPLCAIPGVVCFSLQKGGAPAPDSLPLVDLMPGMADFADTAALIANLDLVIAVDTAVAHLAASLGRPVWLLDRYDPCWRWLRDRTDSPWYPSLRIYRQPSPGDWPNVIARAAADLRTAAATPSPPCAPPCPPALPP